MKIKFILAISAVSSAIYAQSCYSVGLVNISKNNASGLEDRFNFPKECIIAEIGEYASVRCGCHETYQEAQNELDLKYTEYDDAYVVQTSKKRFSKNPSIENKPNVAKSITQIEQTNKNNITTPNNIKYEYVKIDKRTGKLVSAFSTKTKTQKTKQIKKVPKTNLNDRIQKILQAKKADSLQQKHKAVLAKTVKEQIKKPIVKKENNFQVVQKKKERVQKDTIDDAKIITKLKALAPQLKTTKEKDDSLEYKIIEPTKIKPLRESSPDEDKKYFHEEDSDIAEILEFIDSDDELDTSLQDQPTITEDDKEFFYYDFNESNDIYMD